MSTAGPVTPHQPVAARAGADLRAARERLGWSVTAISAELRIRQSHLEALEEGRLSTLPGSAYALAFVRTYAKALGLDAEETVRRFKQELGEAASRCELTFPVPMPERGLPPGALVLVGFVLVVCAYAGWYRLSADGRLPAETVVAIPERLAPLAEQAIPPVQAPPVMVADATTNKPRPAEVEKPALPAPAISPASAAAALLPASAREDPPMGVPPATPPSVANENRVVLRASAASWLMVKDKAGAVLLNRVLKPGEAWAVPARDGLVLTTGNAGGTDVILDGNSTASLGGLGVVRRDLPLDIDAIKDGKLAPLPPQLASIRPRQ